MTVRKITTVGDEVLRQKAREIEPTEFGTPELQRLASDMIDTMTKANGVGIAAPQVGESLRLFIIDTTDGPAALANPVITPRSKKTTVDTEGCLSCPGQEVAVTRFQKISVHAKTLDGGSVNFDAEDFLSRVLQHELDHLDGILIIDKE